VLSCVGNGGGEGCAWSLVCEGKGGGDVCWGTALETLQYLPRAFLWRYRELLLCGASNLASPVHRPVRCCQWQMHQWHPCKGVIMLVWSDLADLDHIDRHVHCCQWQVTQGGGRAWRCVKQMFMLNQ